MGASYSAARAASATQQPQPAVQVPANPVYKDPSTHRVPYAQLKAGDVDGVDPSCKEAYLSDAEFEKVLKVPRAQFAGYKPWKQAQLKKATGLF